MSKNNFRSLLKSNTGSTAIFFALAISSLAVVMGSAIELIRVNDVKTKVNAMCDAAALAGKKAQVTYSYLGEEESKEKGNQAAIDSFNANKIQLDGLANDIKSTIIWDADGAIKVIGEADAELVFGGVFGLVGKQLSEIHVKSYSVVSSGALDKVEVAIVLDNTGSMFANDGRPETRFTLLRQATENFVNKAFDGTLDGKLRFSIIPFATTVNILGEAPSSWDKAASSESFPPDYGSRQIPSSPIDRGGDLNQDSNTLANEFAPVSWRGCVSGNGESLSADDSSKSSMKWDALAVPPYLLEDDWAPGIEVNTTCDPCAPSPPPPPLGSPTQMDGENITKEKRNIRFANFINNKNGIVRNVQYANCTPVACVTITCDTSAPTTIMPTCNQNTVKTFAGSMGRRNSYVPVNQTCYNDNKTCTPPPMPSDTLYKCVSDPNEVAYNNAGGQWCNWVANKPWTEFNVTVGPNLNCPMPMLGLSGNRKQVISAINLMSPVGGGTHNDVGLRWGLRSLSPKTQWANFFGNNGNAPENFGAKSAKKYMILITDGENSQANDFPGYWGCSDTTAPGCSGSPDKNELDKRMLSWCDSIRNNYKVELYTVAVNVDNASAVDLLQQCAGDPSKSFSVDASDLDKTLSEIGLSLFALRLRE